MENLESFKVKELSFNEMQKTDGGIFGVDDAVALGIALVTAAVVEILSDWEHFKDGLLGR